MNTPPDSDMPAALEDLETSIAADTTGELTQTLLKYFDSVAQSNHCPSGDEGEQFRAGQIAAGARASKNVIRRTWEKQHQSAFPHMSDTV